jgi:Ca-activated chloride channel family protein
VNWLDTFHFLRPAWLLMLPPAGLVVWSVLRRQDPARTWKQLIDPQLLEHLVVRGDARRSRFRPVYILAAAWLVGTIALAGPAWEREPNPLLEDQSALFIVVKVAPEMLAEDIQPSRLRRAVQKIGDLLQLRPGARTGLIAYAGSAHLVVPLTSDPEVISFFATELEPDLMPVAGDEPVQALALADRRLEASGLPGSIVMVADSVDPLLVGEIEALRESGSADIHVFAVAAGPEVVPPAGSPPAPALDESAMQAVARAGGGTLVRITPDDTDLQQLASRIERSIASAPVQEGERWKDAGYYLAWLIALLLLPLFRRGGGVALS